MQMLAPLQALIHEAMHLSRHVNPQKVGTERPLPGRVNGISEEIGCCLIEKDDPFVGIGNEDGIREMTKVGG
jgi:hypothetical protein